MQVCDQIVELLVAELPGDRIAQRGHHPAAANDGLLDEPVISDRCPSAETASCKVLSGFGPLAARRQYALWQAAQSRSKIRRPLACCAFRPSSASVFGAGSPQPASSAARAMLCRKLARFVSNAHHTQIAPCAANTDTLPSHAGNFIDRSRVHSYRSGSQRESGIPTFRDAGGLWRNYRFEEVASPHAWRRDPRLVWDFYSMRRRVAAEAKPNPGISPSQARTGPARSAVSLHAECGQPSRASRFAARGSHARRAFQEPLRGLPAARLLTTSKPTSRPRRFPGASVAARFARTSAGLGRCPSPWMCLSGARRAAPCSWPSELRAWSSRRPALSGTCAPRQVGARPRADDLRRPGRALEPRGVHGMSSLAKRAKFCPVFFTANEKPIAHAGHCGKPTRRIDRRNVGSDRTTGPFRSRLKYAQEYQFAARCWYAFSSHGETCPCPPEGHSSLLLGGVVPGLGGVAILRIDRWCTPFIPEVA